MTQPATHRVTVDGTEYSYSGIIVEVTDCAPTYALTHRWGWPDERGVMRCACGFRSDLDSHREYACRVYAPRFSADRGRNHAFQNIDLDTDDVSPFPYEPDNLVEAERQRCERLGVAWVGPDVQDGAVNSRVEEFESARRLRLRVSDQEWLGRGRRDDAEKLSTGRVNTHGGPPKHGGIVRLGLELREADGVTPVC